MIWLALAMFVAGGILNRVNYMAGMMYGVNRLEADGMLPEGFKLPLRYVVGHYASVALITAGVVAFGYSVGRWLT